MAIISTGAIYKSLVFDGESSRDYGIYITGQAVYNAPERDVEMINIPGRNGSFALDKGRFQNIEVTYPAGIFADNETDFAQGISDFRNFLCSRNGYVRLTDDYNPNEYRMAVYKSGLDVSPAQLKAGEFQLVFDCKPQRYLTSGEEPITIGEWHETETASGEIASFEAEAGDAVKSLVADIEPIQSLNGYDKPWSGGAGKNKLANTGATQTIQGITFTVNSDGSVTMNGTSTATANFVIFGTTWSATDNQITLDASKTYTLSKGTSNAIVYIRDAVNNVNKETPLGGSATFTGMACITTAFIQVQSGKTLNNEKIYPMVEVGSSATTYEPYSNICPISGYDSVVVSRCDVNIWDEEWELGVFDNATGQKISNNSNSRSKNYISVKPSTQYYFKSVSNSRFFFYKADKTYISTQVQSANTVVTTPSEAHYMMFQFGGTTYNHDISINYPSTDTLYHAYNGNTYTTDLSGTRYGGTLDVVSGVLTVDRVMETVDVSRVSNNGTLPYGGIQALYTPLSTKKYGTQAEPYHGLMSNRFNPNNASLEGEVNGRPANGNIYFNMPSSATTIDLAKQWFTDNPTQIVYELATPTTVQLTAQEVELLVGLNQVWANSGDVSVEYGTAPNVLINPTLFESSPMLEVEGHGAIAFNGHEIVLDDAFIGEITLANSTIFAAKNKTISLNTTLLNNGDTIIVSGIRLALYVKMSSYTTEGNTSVSDSDSSFASSWTGAIRVNPGQWKSINVSTVLPSFSFTKGNTATYTDTVTINLKDQNGTFTATCGITVTASANAISITRTVSTSPQHRYTLSTGNNNSSIGEIKGDSTQTYLGNPTIVDCDLGEAYRVDDGVVTSLNQYIDLGSDLPKLASGANTITADNTVTDLKVIPRWWRI